MRILPLSPPLLWVTAEGLGFVTEVPKTVYYDSVDRGIPYGATVGALRGAGVGILRTAIGPGLLIGRAPPRRPMARADALKGDDYANP